MHRKTADKLLVAQNHLLSDAILAVIFVIERYIFSINFPDSSVPQLREVSSLRAGEQQITAPLFQSPAVKFRHFNTAANKVLTLNPYEAVILFCGITVCCEISVLVRLKNGKE